MNTLSRINVLQFISSTGFYGAERWVLALSKHLDEKSINNYLLVTTEHNSRDLEIVRKFKSECGEAFELHMRHKVDLSVIRCIVDLIKKKKINIIHTHNYKSDFLGLIAAKIAGIRCIITPHGYDDPNLTKLKFYNWIDKKILKYADALAPLSPQLKEDCVNSGAKQDRIRYIQNGVDLSEVEAVKNTVAKRSSDTLIMGYIGQLISRKNIRDIIDVFNRLSESLPRLELHIVGDGDERADLESYAGDNERIKFLGFRKDRLDLLRQFDLFIMTSKLEGIPRCLMEAAAMDVPIVAYNIPGVDKLITHGETGLLSTYKDIASLVEQAGNLLSDSEVRNRIIENGRNNVANNFSAARMSREYHDLYTLVLEQEQKS